MFSEADIEHDDVTYLNIDVLDMENQNIKKHFEKCFKFIEGGRRDGVVLVHCNAGVSRAPTICIAYLMKKLKVTFEDAFELVKDARPAIEPNSGFVLQLKDYYYELHPDQRPTANTSVVHLSTPPSEQASPSIPAEAVPTSLPTPNDPLADDLLSLDSPADDTVYYTCRVCRFRVFGADELVPHEPGKHEFSYRRRENNADKDCTSHFIEAKDWMGDLSGLEGRIVCPKCDGRLGTYNWGGTQCSCGTWCAPAFQVLKNRVDEKRPVSAVPAPEASSNVSLVGDSS
eukprot:TRINITY_DN1118_c0_g1_i1.p1 TRINITY_DN1118_c0_g1~~TRINITY_DN1118_c0_g1_i1.p1  ORF type:complete len:286 (+),score=44.50 TRINITY_DN1118_c0_g1_i1:420-1277(+)